MNCLKCGELINNSVRCHNCQTNQEEFLFNNLKKLTLDEILAFIFQSNLFDINSNNIKAVLNDLLIYKKKEKNILELLLNDDLLSKVMNTSSLEQAERLVIIETKTLVDTFEIKEELVYNITRSFVQAIKPQFTIREYVKKDQVLKTKKKTFEKPKFKFLMLVVVLTIIASTSLISLFNKDQFISITFKYDDGTIIEEYNAEAGSEVNIPIAYSKDGFTFTGWHDGEVLMEDGGDVLIVPPTDRVFTAVYEENSLYHVIFEDYDGTVLLDGFYEENHILDELPFVEREGYAFSGWFNGKNLLEDIRSIRVPNHDITFTAVYRESYTGYTIIFEDYDGSILVETRIREGGSIYQAHVSIPTRPDHVFKGWKYNGTVLSFNFGTIDNIKEDRVYTAVYEPLESSNGLDYNTFTLTDMYDKLSKSKTGSFNIVGSIGFINEVSKYIDPGLTCSKSCSLDNYSGHLLIQLSESLTEEERYALSIIQPHAVKSIRSEQYVSIEDDGRYIIAIRGTEEYTINIIKEVFNLEE